MDAFVPLLQTLLWVALIVYALHLFHTKLDRFLAAVIRRIESGSSFKAGPVELGEDLRALEAKVAASEVAPSPERSQALPESVGTIGWEKFFEEFFKLVPNPDLSNGEKLVATGLLIERLVANVGVALGVTNPKQPASTTEIVQQFANRGLISNAEKEAFLEFWALRSKMIHGEAGGPTNEQTARMLDLAWRLVRAFA